MWEWVGCAIRAIMQRQVLQSCVDPLGVVPQLQFIDRVDGVRDGVLLVLPSVVHRDKYPQCFPLAGCVLQYIDKVVDVGDAVAPWGRGCSMEACERISHIFYLLLALFAWNLDIISLSPLLWQPLAPFRYDSPRLLLDEFCLFST